MSWSVVGWIRVTSEMTLESVPEPGGDSDGLKRPTQPDEQIALALRQVQSGTAETDVCRQLWIVKATFCVWKNECATQ